VDIEPVHLYPIQTQKDQENSDKEVHLNSKKIKNKKLHSRTRLNEYVKYC